MVEMVTGAIGSKNIMPSLIKTDMSIKHISKKRKPKKTSGKKSNSPKRLFSIITAFLLIIASQSFAFDKEYGIVPEFNVKEGSIVNLDTTIVNVITRGYGSGITPEHKWASGHFELWGTGTVVKHKNEVYIITAAHVVNPKKVIIRTSQYTSVIVGLIQAYSITVAVGSNPYQANIIASVFYMDDDRDIALLKVGNPRLWVNKSPVKWELSYIHEVIYLGFGRIQIRLLIEAGDAIVLPVRARNADLTVNWTFELRKGVIIQPYPYVDPGMEGALPLLGPWHITTRLEVYPGDSGSPVLAFDKGKPIIIGIVVCVIRKEAGSSDYYTYIVPVDYVKWIIEAEEDVDKDD